MNLCVIIPTLDESARIGTTVREVRALAGRPEVVVVDGGSRDGTMFGEGALFVAREVFDAVGGFPDWPLFEDVGLPARLRRATRIGRADGEVIASARRFEARGMWGQRVQKVCLLGLYALGIHPRRLQRFHREVRDGS